MHPVRILRFCYNCISVAIDNQKLSTKVDITFFCEQNETKLSSLSNLIGFKST